MKPQAPDVVVGKFFIAGLVPVLFCLSAFAIYFPQIDFPIVALFGTFGLMGATFLIAHDRRINEATPIPNLLWGVGMIIIFFCSALWAVVQGEHLILKTPIGLSLGVVLLLVVLWGAKSSTFSLSIARGLDTVMALHVLLFFIQVAYRLVSGNYLDYVLILTGESSRYSHEHLTNLPRFTGFFAEPAQYSTLIFMGLSVRLLRRNFVFSFFDSLLLLSIFFTASVYGYFLSLVLLGLSFLQSASRFKAAAFVLLLGITVFQFSQDDEFLQYLFTRTSAPLDDSSGASRLVLGYQRFWDSPEMVMLFGIGSGSAAVVDGEIGNCFAYLLIHFGILGTLILTVLLGGLLHLNRLPFVGAVLVAATMAGAPVLTFSMWWAWLGFLCCAAGLARYRV